MRPSLYALLLALALQFGCQDRRQDRAESAVEAVPDSPALIVERVSETDRQDREATQIRPSGSTANAVVVGPGKVLTAAHLFATPGQGSTQEHKRVRVWATVRPQAADTRAILLCESAVESIQEAEDRAMIPCEAARRFPSLIPSTFAFGRTPKQIHVRLLRTSMEPPYLHAQTLEGRILGQEDATALLRSDLPIRPGDSGAPVFDGEDRWVGTVAGYQDLVDSRGEVVGSLGLIRPFRGRDLP